MVLTDPRHEALAQALARDDNVSAAGRTAGFGKNAAYAWRLSRSPKIIDRVAELVQTAPWGGSSDLVPVINEMAKRGIEAGKLGTAAGMIAARQLLAEAARLKQLLPVPEEAYPPPRRRQMSTREWVETFCPPGTNLSYRDPERDLDRG